MHGKKKHCSHEVYSVVKQMLNVNFVLAGSLQVRYKDTPAGQIPNAVSKVPNAVEILLKI